MSALSSQAFRLFSGLCDRPASEWEAGLDEVGCHEPALRALVLRLLRQDASSGEITAGLTGAIRQELASTPQRIGAFDIDGLVGQGGMGTVWRARHRRTGLPVAIKTLGAGSGASSAHRGAFHAEIRAAARLSHPHIVPIYEHGEVAPQEAAGRMTPGDPYLVMALIEGGPLTPHLATLGWPALRVILRQLLEALSHAHARGLIHRDIKPSNILVDGALPRVCLTDFGIARQLGTRAFALTQSAGTPPFMAPEQIRGETAAQGPWTDLYAIGCLAWSAVTGQPPFVGTSEAVRRAHCEQALPPLSPAIPIPDGLGEWLHRLLQKAPADRFGCAAEALRALERPSGQAPPVVFPARWSSADEALSLRHPLAEIGLSLLSLCELPLVGRRPQRDQLWSLLAATRGDRRPRVAVLEGPGGLGKSRLAGWLCERAVELGVATALRATHADPAGPHDGIVAMLARHLGCEGLDAAGIEAALPPIPDPLRGERESLVALLSGAPPSRSRSARVIHRALQRAAADRPLVVWLDDAHWGSGLGELLAAITESPEPLPALFVLTAPSASARADRAPRPAGSTVIPIGPLSRDEHRVLVRGHLGLTGSLAEEVEQQTAGNAQHAVQLVRSWVAQERLVPGPGGFQLSGSTPPIPASLTETWERLLERSLSGRTPAERRAIELAAALGVVVAQEEWTRLCAQEGCEAPADLLGALEDAGLVRPVPGGWAWQHGLVRQAVLSAAGARQADLHRACAAMLTGARAGLHHWAAGQHTEAATLLVEYARGASNTDPSAPRYLQIARECLRACGAPADDPRWVQLQWLEALMMLEARQIEPAVALLQQILPLASDAKRPAIVDVLARGLMMRGDAAAARLLAQELHEDLSRRPDASRRHRSAVCCTLSMLALQASEPERALEWADRALDQSLAEHSVARSSALYASAVALLHLERWTEAEDAGRRLAQAAREERLDASEARAWNIQGEAARGRGDGEAAERCYRTVLQIAGGWSRTVEALARINLAMLALLRGDAAGAHRHAHPVWLSRPDGDLYRLYACAILLSPAASSGRWEDWDRLATELERGPLRPLRHEPDFPRMLQAAAAAAAAGGPARAERITALLEGAD